VIAVVRKVQKIKKNTPLPVAGADQEGERLFEVAFQQNWERIVSLLTRLVDDPDEAQDLALEVFWRLYNNPPKHGLNLGGWLHRVALNLGYNALRAARRRSSYENIGGRELCNTNSENNPAHLTELSEERRLVRFALAKMKPRQAKLLILRHSGFSYADVAAILSLKASSIGALLARAEDEFERIYRSIDEERSKNSA
jgi:RNA polymerase sigma-70 factor, ECF subfamily